MTEETYIDIFDNAIDVYQGDVQLRFVSLDDTRCRMIQYFEGDVITIDLEV
jgi:hypothetical protein